MGPDPEQDTSSIIVNRDNMSIVLVPSLSNTLSGCPCLIHRHRPRDRKIGVVTLWY